MKLEDIVGCTKQFVKGYVVHFCAKEQKNKSLLCQEGLLEPWCSELHMSHKVPLRIHLKKFSPIFSCLTNLKL